jgi:o-succinylbenzoate synthase
VRESVLKSITVRDIQLHTIALPFVEPLKTSFGNDPVKVTVLVELVTAEGFTGWGEITVEVAPGYAAETPVTASHIAKNFLIPKLIGKTFSNPAEAAKLMEKVRGHHHTKFGLESAIWDALAQANDMRLADLFASYLPEGHASRGYAEVGVSIGIQKTVEDTVKVIQKRLGQGYRRIKLKIQPGWDVELALGVREALPDVVMMLDANSAYTLADAEHLMELDEFNLLMLEQPLADYDIYEHSKLQPRMKTPICLDESIKSVSDLKLALDLGALRILNLKPVRVGGYVESLEIYKICVEHQLPLWIGGMMETGVGRAANVAFASLPGVTMPSDISATDRYYNPDVTEPPFVLADKSRLIVPDAAGLGVTVQPDRLAFNVQAWRDANTYVD